MEKSTLPTKRQRLALKAVGDGKSVSKAMLEAGYSPATAKNPKNLTASKGWDELMEKNFPDAGLALLHKQLLAKREVIVVSDGAREGSHLEWTGQPHTDALKALETAYKLKSRYPSEDSVGSKTLIINITGETASRYGILPEKQ